MMKRMHTMFGDILRRPLFLILSICVGVSTIGVLPQIAYAACTGTVLASASDPSTATIAPGTAITDGGGFTFNSTGGGCGGDTITALTVSLAGAGTPYVGLAEVRITNSAGSTQYFSAITSFSGNTLSFSAGTSLPVTNSAATFKIRITPLSHSLMPVPNGASYALSPTVTGWTGTLAHSGSDTNASTITIDNLSPAAATSVSGSAGNQLVTLGWTSSSGESSTSTILRWASSSAGSEVPAEGSSYSAGASITTATIACVFKNIASATVKSGIIDGSGGSAGCTTSALTNAQAYTYKAFQQDANGNYDTGTLMGTFTPVAPQTSPTVVLTSPTDAGSTNTTPTLSFAGTDAEGDVVEYELQLTNGPADFSVTFTGLAQTSQIWQGVAVDSSTKDVYASSQSGDIYEQTSGSGTFTALGQESGNWYGMAIDSSNHNVYAARSGNDIYKRTGGTGNFIGLSAGGLNWGAVAVDSTTHDVYATGYGMDIYKQTAGSGSFTALGFATQSWRGLAIDSSNHNVYAVADGGDIYMQTAGAGAFNALGQTSRSWQGITVDSTTHSVYASVDSGDIYKQTSGIGSFVVMGQTSRSWRDLAIDPTTRNLYAVDWGGDIYKTTDIIDARSDIDSGFSAGHPFTSGSSVDYATLFPLELGTYYFQVRAKDPSGTNAYGSWSSAFSFDVIANPPTVTTQSASSVGQTSATLNGTITSTGGDSPTVRGFAWGTNASLSGGDTATTTESGTFSTGAFTNTSLTLVCNTTYYSRAYATNSSGNGLGSVSASFTTSACGGAAVTNPPRTLRLFQGFKIKLIKGRIKINQTR